MFIKSYENDLKNSKISQISLNCNQINYQFRFTVSTHSGLKTTHMINEITDFLNLELQANTISKNVAEQIYNDLKSMIQKNEDGSYSYIGSQQQDKNNFFPLTYSDARQKLNLGQSLNEYHESRKYLENAMIEKPHTKMPSKNAKAIFSSHEDEKRNVISAQLNETF